MEIDHIDNNPFNNNPNNLRAVTHKVNINNRKTQQPRDKYFMEQEEIIWRNNNETI